jgi:hypothetical protein
MKQRTKKALVWVAIIILLVGIWAYIQYHFKHFETFASDKRPSIDLVIARYKEPLDWLQRYKKYPFRRIYIYTKSDEPINCPLSTVECTIETLPNVGVCDHTYLYHILKVYDDPEQADITVFLPASANSNSNKKPKVARILNLAKLGIPSISAYKAYDKPENDKVGGPGFYLNEWNVTDKRNRDGDDSKLVEATPRPFGKWFEKYFPGQKMERVSVFGMFAATRDMILSNPRTLYESLIETVERDKYPEAAHYVERSWATLFKGISPKNIM